MFNTLHQETKERFDLSEKWEKEKRNLSEEHKKAMNKLQQDMEAERERLQKEHDEMVSCKDKLFIMPHTSVRKIGRKILEGGSSWRHMFLYSVYMQSVVLVPCARILLGER